MENFQVQFKNMLDIQFAITSNNVKAGPHLPEPFMNLTAQQWPAFIFNIIANKTLSRIVMKNHTCPSAANGYYVPPTFYCQVSFY